MKKKLEIGLDEIEKWYKEGKVSEKHYRELKDEYLKKYGKERWSYTQKFLMGTGFIILAIVILFIISYWWVKLPEEMKTFSLLLFSLLLLSTGIYLWKQEKWEKLARGLTCLGIFIILLFILFMASLLPTNQRCIAGVPLILIPFLGLIFGIYYNSKSLAATSYWMSILFFPTEWQYIGFDYTTLTSIVWCFALLLIILSLIINLLWKINYLRSSLKFYKEREEVFRALIIMGVICLVPFIWFTPFSLLALTTIFRFTILAVLSIFILIWGIYSDFRELIKTGCGILIVDLWFFGWVYGVTGIIVLSIFTAVILIIVGQAIGYLKARK